MALVGRSELHAQRVADATLDAAERMLLRKHAEAFPLQTLSKWELELEREPLTRDPQPHEEALVWVRFGPWPHRVTALVHCWTERAVGVAFQVEGKPYKAWVWRSAVTPVC